ncbi:unnamed protein product [[Actinomadura] parvosata subsp. kistnae]|uniref:Polymerase nucleotidyl transferase domain-containing protein n=1 Tax=[Actinomadura] parvosata subsp. kistnae TaxID=1909395 RepID=A0A1U9ZYH8_9ACTN|nr:hypothetical protein [Nonomuraea sp. ATCC 55076]AQZ63008.1 hypothetical protein BKM31_17455 [Nonomuraea sp. ATCC 55076]SPL99969.1 unnamed protein product [Actinomadura parvosata subsp. kistnae]
MNATDTALEALAAANRPEQFTIMEQTMRLLTASPAVTHLAVRGSFAAGTSDRLSDVDLVVGVREPEYAMFTAAHDALIAARLGQLLPAWPDTIVPDLGGLGFVHLLVHRHMLYQLDLYLAPAGRVERIVAATRGRLMYTAPDHTGAPEGHPQVETFIAAARQSPPTCTELLVEVLVLTWLIRKRIVRGQQFMAYKEAHQLTTATRALARTALSPHTAYLGWYHLETDLGATPIGRACLADLAELAAEPALPTLQSLERMLATVLTLARRAAPEAVEQLATAIDAYRHYLDLR